MKKILFVCVANACRSQMAEAIAKSLDTEKKFSIDSCGASPGYGLDSGVREFLEKRGFELSAHHCKGFEQVLDLSEYDAVITVCDAACVVLPSLPAHVLRLNWPMGDPTGSFGREREKAYQKLFDDLHEKIKRLMDEWKA